MANSPYRQRPRANPNALESLLDELFQNFREHPSMDNDPMLRQNMLEDLLQRAINPYNLEFPDGASDHKTQRPPTRRDLKYLLERSSMMQAGNAGLPRKVAFNQDRMLTAEKLFAEAVAGFQSDLGKGDASEKSIFAEVDSPEALIKSLTIHVEQLNTPHRSRLHDAISKVASFADTLEPYFKLIELIVSSHPEYAAIAWGGVRLVFQLSSQYVEYFEKLASMFAQISEKLPRYSRQFDLISDRGRRRMDDGYQHWQWEEPKWDAYYVSLAKSLAYVYQDILLLCQDACAILPRPGLGKRQRLKRLMTRTWVPIDQRFGKVISRLTIHQRLFEEGLQEAYSTEMIVAFNEMDKERQSTRINEERTQQRFDDFEIARVRQDEKQKIFLEAYFERKAAEDAERAADKERNVKKSMTEKIRDLRAWIAASDWTSLYYAAEKHRAANTGNWFLLHRKYTSWLEDQQQQEKVEMDLSRRLLYISGKPGYGKTVLSTNIIADIRKRVRWSDDTDKGVVAFFHFNAQQPESTTSGNAMRAILTQILHDNKEDTDFIDLAALLMEDMGTGQSNATDREIQSIIRVFLGRLGISYLILDALDECEDWEELLETLEDITRGSNCSVVCLGRPHLSVVANVGQETSHIHLEAKENLDDMKKYIQPKIQILHNRGKLPKTLPVTEVVDKIASRADSMFLWVVLMVGYLTSPLLTPNNRLQAINNIHVLEGLDAMFKQILEDLKRRLPKSEWSKIQRMFQWLVVAQTPWTLEMLRTALAVQPNRPMTSDDYIQDFQESLLQTCGSFVEVYLDGTVRFIHLSVQEFLADPSPEFQHSELSQSFHVQKEFAHCSMATLCMSYIIHNIPHQPIAAADPNSPETPELSATYPLLPYATKWWPVHACQSLRLKDIGVKGYSDERYRVLFSAILDVVWNKPLLSSWIETSYTFQNVPALDTLTSCIEAFQRKYPEIWRPKVESMVDMLNRLTPELNRLNADWGHILRKEPKEIWLPSINAVGRFDLWVTSGDAKMNFLECDEDEGSILIASQVSADGKNVGMLKIWTSTAKDNEVDVLTGSEYWEVAYQIWSLETLSQTDCIRFEIPQEQLLDLNLQNQEKETQTNSAPTRFRFPVAFSSSLSLLVVHGILLKIAPTSELDMMDDRGHFQILPPPGCEHTLDMDALSMTRPMHTGRKRFSFTRGFKIVPADHKCHSWAQYLLSPNERYLIQINGSGPPSEAMTRRWIVSVYKDKQLDNWIPSFYLVASVGIQFRRSSSKDNKVERFLSFHPFLPIVAVCRLATISLWHFMEKDKDLVQIHSDLLDNICWSTCGCYLQGTSPTTQQMVFIDLRSHVPAQPSSIEAPHSSTSTGSSMSVAPLTNPSNDNMQVGQNISSGNSTTNTIQTVGTPVFSTSSSGLSFSSLSQNHNTTSAIVLQNVSSNGVISNSNLMRLPKSTTLEKSYSTLVNTGDNEKLKLVLNMAAQETYCKEEKSDFSLPAVFERKIESVNTMEEGTVGRHTLTVFESVEGRGETAPKGIEALKTTGEDTVMLDAN